MKKKILFFSCEPGGAEVLIPVVKLVQKQGEFEVRVVGYGYALDRFSRKKVACEDISPIQKSDFSLLDYYVPDMLVTSATSLPSVDMSEKYLWWQAKQRGISSLAFLDQWQNYSLRFSGVAEDEKLAYLPDFINCIDEVGEAEMVGEGFDRKRLIKLGQPYLSSLKKLAAGIDRREIRRRLHISPSRHIVLFVSEAIREHFGRKRGYDQYDALNMLIEYLESSNPGSILLLRLHPKDQPDSYNQMVEKSHLDVRIVSDNFSPLESLLLADKVYGMSSIMLVEAFLLGLAVASIQPNLQIDDPFVLTRMHVVNRIASVSDFSKAYHGEVNIQIDVSFDDKYFLEVLKGCVRRT